MRHPALLSVAFFVSSAGLALQSVAGSAIVPEHLTSLAFVWLGFLSGFAFAARLSQTAAADRIWSVIGTLLACAAVLIALAEPLFALSGQVSAFTASLAAGLPFLVPSFCVAFLGSLAGKAAVRSDGPHGLVFLVSAAGTFAFFLLGGYWLVKAIGPGALLAVVAAAYLSLATAAYSNAGELRRRRAALGAIAVAVAASLQGGGFLTGFCDPGRSYLCFSNEVVQTEGVLR